MFKLSNIFLLLLLVFPSFCFSKIELTSKEKQFLEENKKITLGTDKNWEPYTVVSDDGSILGYDISVLNLINEISGASFVIKRGNWSELVDEVKEKKIDGLSTSIKNEQRSLYMNFTKPYLELEKIIFTNTQKNNIKTLKDLEGKILAIDKNNLVDLNFSNTLSKVKILKTNNSTEAINAVTTQKADAMIGNAAMLYILNKKGNPFLKPSIVLPQKDNLKLVFSVRKDYPYAISIINKSLDEIGKQKLLKLKSYWFYSESLNNSNFLKNSKFNLTKDEKEYLNKKRQIKVCVDPDWMPFEKLEDGIHKGIGSDFLKYFKQHININFEIVKTKTWSQSLELMKKKECDILSLSTKTEDRSKYMNFTTSYVSTPIALATKNNIKFIDDLSIIKDQKISIEKDYAFVDILEKEYPNMKLVYTSSLNESLEKVMKGEVFGAIGTIAGISYEVQKNFIGEMKITHKFDEKLNLSMGVRDDDKILLEILEKAVKSISNEYKQKILNKYFSIKYENRIDYTLTIQILIISVLILLIFIYWNRKLSIAKKELEIIKKEIEEKNRKLEKISNTDKLTNTFNRLKLDEFLSEQLTNLKRYDDSFGIILIDIDYFKTINDTFGHISGDKFLISFSKILKESIRETDIVGRWGGEEFLVISPNATKDGLISLSEKLKKKISNYNFDEIGKQTASFGITLSKQSDNIETILSRADEALYRSKAQGRNKVSSSF